MLNYILNINNSFDLTNNTHVSETNGMLLFIVSNSLWQCGKMFDIVKIIWTFCAFHTVAIVKLRYWSISNLNLKTQKRTRADVPNLHNKPYQKRSIGRRYRGGKRKHEEVLEEARGPRVPRSKGPKVKGSQGPIQSCLKLTCMTL